MSSGKAMAHLLGNREGNAVVDLAKGEDLVVGAGLLGLELVAGELEDVSDQRLVIVEDGMVGGGLMRWSRSRGRRQCCGVAVVTTAIFDTFQQLVRQWCWPQRVRSSSRREEEQEKESNLAPTLLTPITCTVSACLSWSACRSLYCGVRPQRDATLTMTMSLSL